MLHRNRGARGSSRTRVSGWGTLPLLTVLAALAVALVSLSDCYRAGTLVTVAEDLLAKESELLSYKNELLLDLDRRLEVLRLRAKEVSTSLVSVREAVEKEGENCAYEVEELDAEWRGKAQMAVQESSFEKDAALERLDVEAKEGRRESEAALRALGEKAAAIERDIEGLKTRRIEVETSRALGRYLGGASDERLREFFGRLRRGDYSDSVFELTASRAEGKGSMWRVDWRGQRSELLGEAPRGGSSENATKALPVDDGFGSKHFPRGGYFPSCAVVGTSGMLLKYKQGAAIDAHHAVFRFDDSPTEGYEEHVGSKTTVRLAWDSKFSDAVSHWRRGHRREIVLQQIDTWETLEAFARMKLEDPQGSGNFRALAPDFALFAGRGFDGIRLPRGFLAVAMAAQKCATVTVFGFSQAGPEALRKAGVPGSYHDDSPSRVFEPSDALDPGPGPGVDREEITAALVAEMSRVTGGKVAISEPCQTFAEQLAGRLGSSTMKVAEGGACAPKFPFPVPRRGYCWLHGFTRRELGGHAQANDFVECGEGEECEGGEASAPCGRRKDQRTVL